MTQTTDRSDDALLLDYLRDRDATCPVCQYNVRALTVPRCPECGRGLKLTVGTLEPYLTPWIILLIATFASTGIAACLDLLFIYNVWWKGRGVPFDKILELLGFFSFNISVLPAFLALFFRRKVLRWPKSAQWFWAIVFMALLIGQICLFVFCIR